MAPRTEAASDIEHWLLRSRIGVFSLLLLSTISLSLGLHFRGSDGSPTAVYATMIFAQFAWFPTMAIAACDAGFIFLRALQKRRQFDVRLLRIVGWDVLLAGFTWLALVVVLSSY